MNREQTLGCKVVHKNTGVVCTVVGYVQYLHGEDMYLIQWKTNENNIRDIWVSLNSVELVPGQE